MAASEIGVIRTLLSSKPRPQGFAERRARIDEIGSVWPVASDIELASVNLGGIAGECRPHGSERSCVLLYFHGGGYCSGSLRSHRRLVSAGMRTLAVDYRLAPEHPFPAALDDALTAWRFLRAQGIAPAHIAVGGDSAGVALSVALSIACARPAKSSRPVLD